MAGDLKAVTKFFLDRAAVQARLDAGKRRVLSKFGAFVRRSSRNSIRKSKKSAPQGQPPKSHRGDLKRLIFFSLDPATDSVVIGPVLFPSARHQSIPAQEALEYAKVVTRRVAVPSTGKRRAKPKQAKAYRDLLKAGLLSAPARQYQTRTFRYRGNPFMGPAFARELENPKLTPLLKDCI